MDNKKMDFSRIKQFYFALISIVFTFCSGHLAASPRVLDLWWGSAHFSVEKVYSSEMQAGHKEGFAVYRPDVILGGGPTVFLYYRCYEYGQPQICLQIYDITLNNLLQSKGSVISPTHGHFSVSPSVRRVNGVWTMVYEEGGSAQGTYWATSSDGITWVKKGALFPENIYRATPSLYDYQGIVYVFYAQKLNASGMGIIFHSGPDINHLVQYGGGYVLLGSQPWDAGHVSMPRIVFQDGFHWMFYEGASVNFNCGPANSNLYGWGIAVSTDLTHWTKWGRNPIIRHDSTYNGDSCGGDMPQPFINDGTGAIEVLYTSNDTSLLVKDLLQSGSSCSASQHFPNWKELNHECKPSCGGMGGTLCYQTKYCGAGTRLGMSNDCGSCCK